MSLEDKCWTAFEERDHKEAVRLLPLVKEPNKIKRSYIEWDNTSLLHLSSRHGWLDVTKDLITKYHSDPHERDSDGRTCLHYAAYDNHGDVMRYLIDECHCDPMVPNKYGDTVLHSVAKNGSLDFMKYLINHHHCDPMATTNSGETVLHHAARHIDIVKYLIDECHCDPKATTNSGETVLHHAARHIDIVKYLIDESHCDPKATTKDGVTVLHLAARHIDIVKYLIDECHCDPMAVNRWGWTPLHFAAGWGCSAAVGYLLSTGHTDTLSVMKKFGGIKSSHPIDSYVNVLLVGNPGAGKSTLSHVINDTATGSIVLASFRNVGGVVPCTAGIIPYKLQHRTLGNIILHDFAGHSEYYSSHSAVIENLLQGSGGVFLIVVNILEKEPVKQLHQWLTV
uniref:Uncharacterized protein n=1 Tax=Amphimedon queenslandica TaxID=400682 RepID=A0A1X7SZJ4_AMPQE